jgi:hypothetical protein
MQATSGRYDQKTDSVNQDGAVLASGMARRLGRRAPLALDARRPFAIKRCVHEIDVDADARALAAAFREVVTDPAASFGLLRLKRPADRVGRPFAAGDRFHGCLSLRLAARGPLAALLAAPPLAAALSFLEDRLLSDYAEIVEIAAEGAAQRLVYRYLEGTPIAGTSTLAIEPRAGGGARVTQVFEFQEVRALALGPLHRFALKRHDEITHRQVQAAAERIGARITRSTIARAYAGLLAD